MVDIIAGLRALGHAVDVHDPHADPDEARQHLGIELLGTLESGAAYDAVIGAVRHREYGQMGADELVSLLAVGGLLADIKGMWREIALPDTYRRWQL